MIDVISPCVTFNDHDGSTKSYAYVKDHDEILGEINFVPFFEDISVEYEPGGTTQVRMHDGSQLMLRKVTEDYNPTDKMTAIRLMHESLMRGEFATGVVYVEPDKEDFLQTLNLVSGPLAALPQDRVRPSKAVLDQLMDSLR
jgi:2-oxoglutarate ferredoxin oxidoreductase subunit beta